MTPLNFVGPKKQPQFPERKRIHITDNTIPQIRIASLYRYSSVLTRTYHYKLLLLHPYMTDIAKNLGFIRVKIIDVAARLKRDPNSIKLVAVSKTHTVSDIRDAFLAGQVVFGENYAQELKSKAEELMDLKIDWHFIGHLQKNKIKYIAPIVSTIETIDSFELAEAVSKRISRRVNCLIEVNIGSEASKSGANEANLLELIGRILPLPNINLTGLMIIPPYDLDPEKGRPYFKKLRELRDFINNELSPPKPLTELSMGMSHDFPVAIEEGATIVRVGTAIFGERVYG